MNQLEGFNYIGGFIFDVDGVLTDNRLLVQEDGALLRQMHTRDGYALQLAVKEGYHVAIITGGNSAGVTKRLQGLGIKDVFSSVSDKRAVLTEYVRVRQLHLDSLLYMGDDMPDLPAMTMVGLPTCPADACPDILAIARYVSPIIGGAGCVRDVIEKTLKIQGKWK